MKSPTKVLLTLRREDALEKTKLSEKISSEAAFEKPNYRALHSSRRSVKSTVKNDHRPFSQRVRIAT
jgi:hypothetical protein